MIGAGELALLLVIGYVMLRALRGSYDRGPGGRPAEPVARAQDVERLQEQVESLQREIDQLREQQEFTQRLLEKHGD